MLGFQEKDYVDLMSGLSITNMLVAYEDYKQRIDKAVEVIDLITPELWNISNKMTYRLKDVKNILRGDE